MRQTNRRETYRGETGTTTRGKIVYSHIYNLERSIDRTPWISGLPAAVETETFHEAARTGASADSGRCSTDADGGGRIGERAGIVGADVRGAAISIHSGGGGAKIDAGSGVERVMVTEPHC